MNANILIHRSIQQNEIAHEDWTEDLARELAARCDASVDAGDTLEFWGMQNGHPWRVHLDHVPQESEIDRQRVIGEINGNS